MTASDIGTCLPDEVTIEPMTDWDIEQVASIERASFRRPWQPGAFRTEMQRGPSRCLVARNGHTVCGYVIFWSIPPEIHVLNVAVKLDRRGQGLGRMMMNHMLKFARSHDSNEVFLEVRPSNTAAIRLYQSLGFKPVGLRKNYYAEDNEDAIIMALKL